MLVSTDKAVAPATVMGASKALAEWAVEAAQNRFQRHPLRGGALRQRARLVGLGGVSRYRQVKHSQEEKIGNFSYLSIYAPVSDEIRVMRRLISIFLISLPTGVEPGDIEFLVTLINLNAFIFLIAGLIALFITNRITRSFSVISEKMKEVNLGRDE